LDRIRSYRMKVGAVGALALAALLTLAVSSASGKAFAAQVSCGQVITQDTKVINDLIDCPGDGLVVGADDITLDLNGHKITALPREGYVPRADAIRGSANDVTVKNGVVGPFVYGISLDGNNNLIEDNFIVANHPMQVNGDGNVIEGNRTGGSDGVFATGNRNVFVGNSIDSGHGGLGAEGDGNLIERNSVRGDWGIGSTGLQNKVLRNVVSGGYGGGIGGLGREVVIERNVVSGGTLSGITVYLSEGARVARNLVSGGGDERILVRTSDGAVIERNVVSGSYLGIHVETSSGALVERNQVSHVNGDGIVVGPSVVVTRNVASFNAGLGIYGEPGVVDGGGNKAFGNGNPLQCLNVVCN